MPSSPSNSPVTGASTPRSVKRPASDNLILLHEVKRISTSDGFRSPMDSSMLFDVSAIAGLEGCVATKLDGQGCSDVTEGEREMPSTPRRIIQTVRNSLQSKMKENVEEVIDESKDIKIEEEDVKAEDENQQSPQDEDELVVSSTIEVLPFQRSPYEGGLILRESVPKRFEAMHPLDHPLLRFFINKRELKRSLHSRINAVRKGLDLTLNQSTLTACPLCSPNWCPPKSNFTALVKHYEDVHWRWRQTLYTGREGFIIFPCYRNHTSNCTKRLIHNAMFSKNRIENKRISGLSDSEANILSVINTNAIRNFLCSSYTKDDMNEYSTMIRPLVQMLRRNFGYNQQGGTDNVCERNRIMEGVLKLHPKYKNVDKKPNDIDIDIFGIVIDSLPHWHCPVSRSDLGGSKKVTDLWGDDGCTVENWFLLMDNEGESSCTFTTLDFSVLIEHVDSHYDHEEDECGPSDKRTMGRKEDLFPSSIDQINMNQPSTSYVALANDGSDKEDQNQLDQPVDDIEEGSFVEPQIRRVSFNQSVEVVEIDVIESRMEQYGSLQDEGRYSWDIVDEESEEIVVDMNTEYENRGSTSAESSPSLTQDEQEYIIMIRKDNGTLQMIKGVEITKMDEKQEDELPIIYCKQI